MKKFYLLVLSMIFISCSDSGGQRDFEQEAFREPSGITRTDAQGSILEEDEDDWRISPVFQGLIEVIPAFPNPTTVSTLVNIGIDITGVQALNGLQVFVLFRDGASQNSQGLLFFDDRAPLPPGFFEFQINPIQLSRFGNPDDARGLHRILIYDLNNRLISYGDIRVD